MYRLFYNYHTLGDVLMIVLNNQKRATHLDKRNDVTLIYSDFELIGINLFNISKIVRIKAQGMIVSPAKEFLEVINHILKNEGLEPLSEQSESGFVVGQILELIECEDHPFKIAKVDIGSRVIYTKSENEEIAPYSMVVIALADTLLFNGETVVVETHDGMYFEGRICTYKDLNLESPKGDEKMYIIEEFMEIGQDFFAKE
jgi:tRNA-binding protein